MINLTDLIFVSLSQISVLNSNFSSFGLAKTISFSNTLILDLDKTFGKILSKGCSNNSLIL